MIATTERALAISHDATTHDDAKQEGKYDTRAIESGYLAGAQSERLVDLNNLRSEADSMTMNESKEPDQVTIGCFVISSSSSKSRHYILTEKIGGISIVLDDLEIFVVSQKSPVATRLIGNSLGDTYMLGDSEWTIDHIS